MVQIVEIDQNHIRFEFLRSWKSQNPTYKHQTGQQEGLSHLLGEWKMENEEKEEPMG